MKMIPVVSSNIEKVGYEDGKMRVQFHNGGVYEYETDEHTFECCKSADSVGKFFYQHIKGLSHKKID